MTYLFSIHQPHSEMALLTNRVGDYPNICFGKTRIPGINDGEEMELTDVSARDNLPV